MYVCICNAVNERRIQKAVQDGTRKFKTLCRELNIASQCGKCALCAKACFDQELAKQSEPAAPVQG